MDGLEVFNAATALARHNENALAYARKRGLPMTAGSDAHYHAAIGRSYTIFPAATLSTHAILASIREGTQLHCRPLGTLEALRKTFFNWFRISKRRIYPTH
jgi:predicted metal-dependent phosphoesterase TrpH